MPLLLYLLVTLMLSASLLTLASGLPDLLTRTQAVATAIVLVVLLLGVATRVALRRRAP